MRLCKIIFSLSLFGICAGTVALIITHSQMEQLRTNLVDLESDQRYIVAVTEKDGASLPAGSIPVTLVPVTTVTDEQPLAATIRVAKLLDALHQKEASGRLNPPPGDGGRAIGPMQLWFSYWLDANYLDHLTEEERENFREEYVREASDLEISRLTVLKYWERWCPTALAEADLETLAMAHNGGGPFLRRLEDNEHPLDDDERRKLRNLVEYWLDVESIMEGAQ